MKDVQFMTATEKDKTLKQWETFLRYGLQPQHFTKALYHHLIQHCSFIAHYNQGGFYDTYFSTGDGRRTFLRQFDNRNGTPQSVEYGETWWITGGADRDYEDINTAMIEVATRYIPALLQAATESQKQADVAAATALLKKHGMTLESH